jgi:hypothetical protein
MGRRPVCSPTYARRALLGVTTRTDHARRNVVHVSVDVAAAERFIFANARLLDRRRVAVLLHGEDAEPALDALRAYRNPDGGFGHALEPDVRAPGSEPAATLHALEVLAELSALGDPMVAQAAAWIARVAEPDGGVPFVLAGAARHPHAPWMVASEGGSQLTFALAGLLSGAGAANAWLARAVDWCWARLEGREQPGGYAVKFALCFLDAVSDDERARACVQTLRARLDADGSLPVAGGTADERLTPLALSPRPNHRSRAMFTDEQIELDLERLECGQLADGGWTFDWLAWSPGQSVEWRGIVTLRALATLGGHGRIELPQA